MNRSRSRQRNARTGEASPFLLVSSLLRGWNPPRRRDAALQRQVSADEETADDGYQRRARSCAGGEQAPEPVTVRTLIAWQARPTVIAASPHQSPVRKGACQAASSAACTAC